MDEAIRGKSFRLYCIVPSQACTVIAIEQNENKQTSRQMNMSLAAVSGREDEKRLGFLQRGSVLITDELSEAEQAVDMSALLHYESLESGAFVFSEMFFD